MEEVFSCFLKMKILFLVLLVVFCCISLTGAAEENNRLERIETCGSKCSQGLDCRMKSQPLFPPPCRRPPEDFNTSIVFPNISLSTVMKCEGKQKCSLLLRIQTRLQLKDSIHGVSVCTASPGLMTNCKVISFSRDSRERLSGSQVEIENDCTKISPSQEVQITVQTVPPYCHSEWTGVYTAPGCTNDDLQSHVPECITGKLSYKVNLEEKSLTVNVSEALEDHNYILRLCHAKGYICGSTGAMRVIKKEDPVKTATLSYSRLLPCLCIEGWSAVTDARRVQVCPFRHRVEELWSGITFDPTEASLSWQPSCPVTAVLTLCQNQEDICIDLPHTTHSMTRQKVKFIGVEPHPQLCMKFAVGSQEWIKCPFADGRFPAWEVVVSRHPEEVSLLSPSSGIFSVELCAQSAVPPNACHAKDIRIVNVEKHASVGIDIPADLLQGSFCLQVKRVDVKFAAIFSHCFDKPKTSLNPTWIIVPVSVLLTVVILTTLMLHIWLTVHQRRGQKGKEGPCLYEKQKDCGPDYVIPALQSESAPPGGVFVPDSPQCRSNEKANLLYN